MVNSIRKSILLFTGSASNCWKILLATTLLVVSCDVRGLEATPVPLVFNSPPAEINSFTTLTIVDKDDPNQAHWVDYFGGSVDIDGDAMATGAPRWNRPPGEGDGAAYVYRRSQTGEWQAEATLIPSDQDDGFQYDQHFGESIALNGTVIAVGAPGYDDSMAGDNTGAVYIFEYDGQTWMETGKIIPASPKPGAKFGSSLAYDGDLIAVSGSPEAGSAWIFQREPSGGWRELVQVPVPASADGEPTYVLLDLYGGTLALSTVTMYSLEEQDEQVMLQSLKREGIVTLFEREGDAWKQSFQTTPQEASLYRMYEGPYGIPISLGGEGDKASWLAVGKPGFTKSPRETGSVVLYERENGSWQAQVELSLATGEKVPGALPFFGVDPGPVFFGAHVDFEGDRLAVVATFANSVYVFERQDQGWVYQYRITPGPEFGDDFQRRTVAISGSDLLLGSPGELGGGNVYIFSLPK